MTEDTISQLERSITYHDLLRTGSSTLAGRYLRRFWHPVGRSEDLTRGTARPVRLMAEDFTLFRGESGAVHLLEQRCAHRGAQLSPGWVEGDSIKCIYHGWTYDGTGQCVAQPCEPRPFCDKVKIRSYPVQEYLGLIFVYVGEGAPPPLPQLPEFEAPDYLHLIRVDEWPCNYFLQLENSMDWAHLSILHWHFHKKVPLEVRFKETEYGIEQVIADDEAGYERSHFMMPTAHEWASPGRRGEKVGNYTRGFRVPIDDGNHIRINLNIFPVTGAEVERYRADLEKAIEKMREDTGLHWATRPVPDFANDILECRDSIAALKAKSNLLFGEYLTDVQDCTAMRAQGDVAHRTHHEQLGATDRGIMLLRRIYARELAALADGRPLTDWKRPNTLYTEMRDLA